MGGARVENAHVRLLDPLHRIPGGIVGEAEHDDVRAVQRLPSGAGILAALPLQGDQRKIIPRPEPLVDPEAGRSGVAVDEDARLSHGDAL
jgi:hypothetical protein